MSILDNRKKYREVIGEFILAFSQVELYLTMYDSIIDSKNTINPTLISSFSIPLTIKLNHINSFIERLNDSDLFKSWIDVKAEIEDINVSRNHIIHGTGISSFWSSSINTMLDEGIKKTKGIELTKRIFSVDDITNLSERTYQILTGVNGIQGDFLQEFLKTTRAYFLIN